MSKDIEIVRSPIEGKVAAIVSERELAINRGSRHGVVRGMRFRVVGSSTPIEDPDTQESLGAVRRDKVRVQVSLVEASFAVCKTYESIETGSAFGTALFTNFLEPRRTVPETLKAEDASYIPELSEDESFVKKGDTALQILNDATLDIKDVENVLRNATFRGALKMDEVQDAVVGWRKADVELSEVKDDSSVERTELLTKALEEYNRATRTLTRLYNNATTEPDD